jgi:hypothetical protein
MCPKIVAVKFSTERLIVHDTPEGVECAGSELPPPQAVPVAAEWTPSKKSKRVGKGAVAEPSREPGVPAAPSRAGSKSASKGGSIWTVSGGLPGLGKRR